MVNVTGETGSISVSSAPSVFGGVHFNFQGDGKNNRNRDLDHGRVKPYICDIQEYLINFYASSHQRLYELGRIIEGSNSADGQQANRIKNIRNALDRLEECVNAAEINVYVRSQSFLQSSTCKAKKGFKSRARITRCSVDYDGDQPVVLDEYRDDGVQLAYSDGVPVDNNTGFETIWSNSQDQRFYLENDIPNATYMDKYRNSRIIRNEVVRRRGVFGRKLYNSDVEWRACWKPYSTDRPLEDRSCYRSTLIVPIGLSHQQVHDDLRGYLREKTGLANDPLFGFLCFDHVKKGFFTESDVDTAQFVSDMLSLVLFKRHMVTNWSTTYNKAKQLLHISQQYERESDVITS